MCWLMSVSVCNNSEGGGVVCLCRAVCLHGAGCAPRSDRAQQGVVAVNVLCCVEAACKTSREW